MTHGAQTFGAGWNRVRPHRRRPVRPRGLQRSGVHVLRTGLHNHADGLAKRSPTGNRRSPSPSGRSNLLYPEAVHLYERLEPPHAVAATAARLAPGRPGPRPRRGRSRTVLPFPASATSPAQKLDQLQPPQCLAPRPQLRYQPDCPELTALLELARPRQRSAVLLKLINISGAEPTRPLPELTDKCCCPSSTYSRSRPASRSCPAERGFPGRLRRRDHTSHCVHSVSGPPCSNAIRQRSTWSATCSMYQRMTS